MNLADLRLEVEKNLYLEILPSGLKATDVEIVIPCYLKGVHVFSPLNKVELRLQGALHRLVLIPKEQLQVLETPSPKEKSDTINLCRKCLKSVDLSDNFCKHCGFSFFDSPQEE